MGPREKKKESTSPRKQQSIEGFFKPITKSVQKRPRDAEPGEGKESPAKKPKEVPINKDVFSNNNEIDPTAANNNNNNNNNKEKAPEQRTVGVEKSPDEAKKKEKKRSEKVLQQTTPKKEKNSSPQKRTALMNSYQKIEKMDIPYGGEGLESDNVDDPVTPHPLINIPESDHILIMPQEDAAADAAVPLSEGEFIGPDIPVDSEEYREAERGVPELIPINVTSASTGSDTSLPATSLSNEVILTPSPSPSPQVPQKSFKCKVCDEWFPNRYFQRKHMLMEHEDQLYECRVCSYNSCDPEKLKSHIIKMHVAKKERTEMVTIDEAQYDLDELITKQTPRKVIMEDGVALGRDPSSKMRFICAICDRIYTSKYSLERHVRCHTGEKPYTCDVCNFTTSYREHMQRHMTSVHLIVHSDEPKQKYIPKSRKKTEEKNVSTEDDDDENGMIVVTEVEESHDGSFESHNSSSDTVSSSGKKRRNILRKRFECAACGLKATHKTDLIDHIREKHPNAHIESLENGDGSKVHLIVTASKKSNTSRRMVITCPNCFMIFHDTWKYKVHMRSHTGVKPFGCSLCSFRATSKMTIRDHVHRKHKDSPNPKILLRTVGIDGTVQHVELSFPQREFKCDVCGENFSDNYHMKQHKKKNHSESLPFSCVECGHREWARASIIIHCLSSHPEINIEGLVLRNNKPFTVGPHKLPKCDVCDKVFSYQSQLYLHQRQHTGERTYVCDICNYRTNHKPALQKHIEKHLIGPDSSKKNSRKKNATKETDVPINFVEVEGGNVASSASSAPSASSNVLTSIKKEGAKKNVKVKKESEKAKKDNEKGKKEHEKVKKETEKGKKDNEKGKKENEKGKKDHEKAKRDYEKAKKDHEKAKKVHEKAKKDNVKVKNEKAAAKEKGSEKGKVLEKEKVSGKEKGSEIENCFRKEMGSEKENGLGKENGSEKQKNSVTSTGKLNVP